MPRSTPAVLLALIAAPVLARDTPVPPVTPVGEAVPCVSIVGLRSEVRSDRVIDFTAGRRAWRNTLPASCPALGFERRFSYATSLSQLCSSDIITVLQGPGIQPGASCGLGKFQPIARPERPHR